jgi:hypothetical protein
MIQPIYVKNMFPRTYMIQFISTDSVLVYNKITFQKPI